MSDPDSTLTAATIVIEYEDGKSSYALNAVEADRIAEVLLRGADRVDLEQRDHEILNGLIRTLNRGRTEALQEERVE